MNALGHDQAARRRAALTGLEVRAVDSDLRPLQIGVVEHDERVLAAHFELDARAVLDRGTPMPRPTSCDP